MTNRLVALVLFLVPVFLVSLDPLPRVAAQQKAAPPTVPASFPTLTTPLNLGAKPGAKTDLLFTGTNLTDVTGVWTSFEAKAIQPTGPKDATKLKVSLDIPATVPPGLYAVRVATKTGVSNLRPFCVDDRPEVAETDKNKTKSQPQVIPASCVVTGKAEVESSDFFRVPVQAGQPVTFEVLARRLGSPFDPVVILHDGTGKEMPGLYADDTPGLQGDARVSVTPKQSGDWIVEVRDATYRGGADFVYRLRIGSFPGVTTAFPLALERGKTGSIQFSGPGLEQVKPVSVTTTKDSETVALYAAPSRFAGHAGWPVPVLITDRPEILEQEPNAEPAKANRLPVPGGISARFAEKNDIDQFVFTGKKGAKVVIQALTYEVNSPAEVYIRVRDAKGAELAKSNPQQATRVEFTPTADGDYYLVCEHVNYIAGPSEVYHLSVVPATPDFGVGLGLDRVDIPAGGVGLLPISTVSRLNGFAGAIKLSIQGEGLSGTLTVPPGANPQPATPLYLPIQAKGTETPGPRSFVVQATATIDGKTVTRFGSVADIAKAAWGGLPVPPPEFQHQAAAAVTPASAYTLTVKLDMKETAAGGTVKGKVAVKRTANVDGEIPLTAVGLPANVTAKLKPIPKGQTEVEWELTAAANAPVGPFFVILRGTTKVGGADQAVLASPVPLAIIPAAKKEEPKKTEPKKK